MFFAGVRFLKGPAQHVQQHQDGDEDVKGVHADHNVEYSTVEVLGNLQSKIDQPSPLHALYNQEKDAE